MKKIAFVLLCFSNTLVAQQVTNQKEYKPYDGDFRDVYFAADNQTLVTTSSFEEQFLLNDSVGTTKTLDILQSGASAIHPDGSKVGIIGRQYYDKTEKKVYNTVLQLVDTKDGTVENIFFEKPEIQSFKFHPTNDALIAAIMMDENFEYLCAIVNIETKKVEDICLQGKGRFIPLMCDFTPDGSSLLIGYGNSSYYGGFTIYDLEAKKETKRVQLKDQPVGFTVTSDKVVMRGNKTVQVYDRNWNELSKMDRRLVAIHPTGEFGIYFTNDKEAFFMNLQSGEKTKLDIPILKEQDFSKVNDFRGYARFSNDGTKVAIKFIKWNKFKEIKMPEKPSFMTFDVSL